MAAIKSLILLGLLSATGLTASIAKRDSCHAGQTTINGELFTIQCGVDRAGNNEDNGIPTSFNGCGSACAADSQCLSAEYKNDNGFCYRKSGPQNQLSLVSGVSTFDNGSGCTDNLPIQLASGATCSVKCNTDSPGNNLAAYPNGQYTGSYAGCAQLCSTTAGCKTAQYAAFNGFCYPKGSVNGNGYVSNANIVTVVC